MLLLVACHAKEPERAPCSTVAARFDHVARAGLGSGVPHAVPIVTSDFIYAEIAEEIGLIGCGMLLMVYAVLFSRGFRAAGAAKTPFERLLCVGLTGSLAVQTILNVAGVTKALPMTGITLPLVSYGGSSLVISMFLVGLVLNVGRRPERRAQTAQTRDPIRKKRVRVRVLPA